MNGTKLMKRLGIIAIMAVVALSFSFQPVSAAGDKWGPVKKMGKYYFKVKYGDEYAILYVSKKKGSGYVKTPAESTSYAVIGNDIYYTDLYKSKINRYSITKKKVKTVKKLKDLTWGIEAVAGKYIWLNEYESGQLYRFNTGNNKLKLIRKNCSLIQVNGKYCVGGAFQSEESAVKTYKTIYRVTKSGKLEVVKKLGNAVLSDHSLGLQERDVKTFLYATGRVVYRINANGKNKKRIVSFRKGTVDILYNNMCYLATNGTVFAAYYFKSKKYINNITLDD